MIEKWFRQDIEDILKKKHRVVVAVEDENAMFLRGLIPADYAVYDPETDLDELKARYDIERGDPERKTVIFCRSSRDRLTFIREYCETCGCIDIKFLHNYVKEKVYADLNLHLRLTPTEIVTAAKLSRGKGKDYWLDIVHKGKDRIIDIVHEILPFLNDPENYCRRIDVQVKKAFSARVNQWLGRENIEQPPEVLAAEAALKILGSLVRSDGEPKFKTLYKKWADSKKYEARLNQYIAETKPAYGNDIWAVDVSHPFFEIDRKWMTDISRHLGNRDYISKRMDRLKHRAADRIGKKITGRLWDDIIAILEFEPGIIRKIQDLQSAVTFYTDRFYRLDTAIRRLYAAFLNEPDMIRPFQEYYESILAQFLDKWYQFFDDYRENQSGMLYELLENRKDTCAVIVGDGITFEISKIVFHRLKNRYRCVLSYKQADFPSTTENNMSRIYMDDQAFEPVHKKREYALAKRCSAKIGFSALEEVSYATKTDRHLICSYRDIDQAAEKMQNSALKLISKMEDALMEKIEQLVKCGFKSVYLTSDHGFVLTGLLAESDKIEFDSVGTVDKHERYVETVDKQTVTDRFIEKQRRFQEYNYVYFHRSNRPFKTPGSYGYSHGGISPQELIVPFLCVEPKPSTSDKPAVKISNKSDLKAVVGDIFEIRLDTGQQKDLFSTGRKIVILFMAEGKQVNKSDIITVESGQIVKKEYGFDDHDEIQVVVVDAETRETLDKVTVKRTSIRDMGGLL